MLVLGASADDKGAQLEALIASVLRQQGYTQVSSNVVGSGGNELDVVAVRETALVGGVQRTPLMCEAKAYADSVNMPTWQRFLGKLFIERSKDIRTTGLLVALNGVNGNVTGSLSALQDRDSAIFVFDGRHLTELARQKGEVGSDASILRTASAQFGRQPSAIDTAYYDGAFYQVVRWSSDSYSITDGQGNPLPSHQVEDLRAPLTASLRGLLLEESDARAEGEALHDARLEVLGQLFRGRPVQAEHTSAEVFADMSSEPYCSRTKDQLRLIPASELDAPAIARLFLGLFRSSLRVARLSFMRERHHAPYVDRLVFFLSHYQSGFTLDDDELKNLRDLALFFPSIWVRIAEPNPLITTHRSLGEAPIDAVGNGDRDSFWEGVVEAIRSDFTNAQLRGFLYDYMGVAELEDRSLLTVKGKGGPIGAPIGVNLRTAVRQFTVDPGNQSLEPVFVLVRMLPNIVQPWEENHPEPTFPLPSEKWSDSKTPE